MSTTTCKTCGQDTYWRWEEAFDKFGFNDGDGMVMTETVASALELAGYDVKTHAWGWHNVVIDRIRKDGVDLIDLKAIQFGYDNPRDYLPDAIIELLDTAFPEDGEVQS